MPSFATLSNNLHHQGHFNLVFHSSMRTKPARARTVQKSFRTVLTTRFPSLAICSISPGPESSRLYPTVHSLLARHAGVQPGCEDLHVHARNHQPNSTYQSLSTSHTTCSYWHQSTTPYFVHFRSCFRYRKGTRWPGVRSGSRGGFAVNVFSRHGVVWIPPQWIVKHYSLCIRYQ